MKRALTIAEKSLPPDHPTRTRIAGNLKELLAKISPI